MKLQINKTDNNINLIFSDNVGKYETNEILDEYYLTNSKLLNILQSHDEMLKLLKYINNNFDIWDSLPSNVQKNIYTLIK